MRLCHSNSLITQVIAVYSMQPRQDTLAVNTHACMNKYCIVSETALYTHACMNKYCIVGETALYTHACMNKYCIVSETA